jgi:hypothetical protein
MTNIFKTADKLNLRHELFRVAVDALQADGWKVEKVPRSGKGSVRKISRGTETRLVSIRTSQDCWIAFPPKVDGEGWLTLDDVDDVVAASVDDKYNPTCMNVHLIPGSVARSHFDRNLEARRKAGHVVPQGRGIWISLYEKEASAPVNLVGAGLGRLYPPIAVEPLDTSKIADERGEPDGEAREKVATLADDAVVDPLSIPEAKRRLALTLGVPESAIKITIEH